MFLMDLKLRSSFTLIVLYVFNGFKIEIQLYTDSFTPGTKYIGGI